jgi:hypothetical protein
MIEAFLCGTWICGQVLYWLVLKHRTAFVGEGCWRMLNSPPAPTSIADFVIPTSPAQCSWKFEAHRN